MNLTDNFTLEEMTHSDVAESSGIDNTPSQEVINNLQRLTDQLQVIRNKWGSPIKVTSGYRCLRLNKLVKGSSTSQHICGTAADITTGSKAKNKDLFNLIVYLADRKSIMLRQIIDEYDYSWIHLSVNDDKHTYRANQVLHLK